MPSDQRHAKKARKSLLLAFNPRLAQFALRYP